jgi:hypothetical protein
LSRSAALACIHRIAARRLFGRIVQAGGNRVHDKSGGPATSAPMTVRLGKSEAVSSGGIWPIEVLPRAKGGTGKACSIKRLLDADLMPTRKGRVDMMFGGLIPFDLNRPRPRDVLAEC